MPGALSNKLGHFLYLQKKLIERSEIKGSIIELWYFQKIYKIKFLKSFPFVFVIPGSTVNNIISFLIISYSYSLNSMLRCLSRNMPEWNSKCYNLSFSNPFALFCTSGVVIHPQTPPAGNRIFMSPQMLPHSREFNFSPELIRTTHSLTISLETNVTKS